MVRLLEIYTKMNPPYPSHKFAECLAEKLEILSEEEKSGITKTFAKEFKAWAKSLDENTTWNDFVDEFNKLLSGKHINRLVILVKARECHTVLLKRYGLPADLTKLSSEEKAKLVKSMAKKKVLPNVGPKSGPINIDAVLSPLTNVLPDEEIQANIFKIISSVGKKLPAKTFEFYQKARLPIGWYHVYGRFGAGKSMFAQNVFTIAELPKEIGGMREEGKYVASLYVTTEKNVNLVYMTPKLFWFCMKGKLFAGASEEEAVNDCLTYVYDFTLIADYRKLYVKDLIEFIGSKMYPKEEKAAEIFITLLFGDTPGVVVFDSITALLKHEFMDRQELPQRAKVLRTFSKILEKLVDMGYTVITTGQIISGVGEAESSVDDVPFANSDSIKHNAVNWCLMRVNREIPWGGEHFSHDPRAIIHMCRPYNAPVPLRYATIIDNEQGPAGTFQLYINKGGVLDAELYSTRYVEIDVGGERMTLHYPVKVMPQTVRKDLYHGLI